MLNKRSKVPTIVSLGLCLGQASGFVSPLSACKRSKPSANPWSRRMDVSDEGPVMDLDTAVDQFTYAGSYDDDVVYDHSYDYTGGYSGDFSTESFENDDFKVEFFENSNSNSGTADIAKDIVLGAISSSSPSQMLDGVNLNGEVTPSAQSNVDAVLAASKLAIEEAAGLSAENSFTLDGVDTNDDVTPSAQRNLDAVLAASKQAVAEAGFAVDTSDTIDIDTPVVDSLGMRVETLPDIRSITDVAPDVRTKEKTKIDSPSVQTILKFAIPAIGVWLCSPLLSLIDTSAVGLFSGTAQQAALNPAVAVTDYAALLIAFMYTGTTNLVAAAQETDSGVDGKPQTTAAFTTALQLSGYVGLALGGVLFAFARPLLRAIIGNDSISPVVFDAAMKYVRIRALGMPAAAFVGSAQAGCLGMKDIRSPLYVLAAAATVNFLGDLLFVGNNHPWIGGAAGAAWATVFSQYAAVAFFVRWLFKRPPSKPVVNVTSAIMELTGCKKSKGHNRRMQFRKALRFAAAKLGATKKGTFVNEPETPKPIITKQETKETEQEESFSTRAFLVGKLNPMALAKLPSKKNAKEFAPYVLPVTSTQVGRVSSYVAMSHVVSSSLGTVSMAAQQIIVSLFYCLCPIADSLSLTAQSFVPTLFEKEASKERANVLRKTTSNFLKAGGVFGGFMMAAVACIPLLSGIFTSDPVVISMVNSVVPLLLGVFSVHGVLCSAEGLLLGQKDLGFLGKMYAGFFAAVPYFMLRVKRTALTGGNVGLKSVWGVFLSYQLFRFAAWVGRVAQLQRRTEQEAERIRA